MNFGLAQITNLDSEKNDVIRILSDELKEYFKLKSYGQDIKTFTIGIVTVKPVFEQFHKESKPKYIKGKKTIKGFGGIPIELEDSLEYSIKLNYQTLSDSTNEICKKIVSQAILNSLSIVESMRGKIKDFDIACFKSDLEKYFKGNDLI